MNCFYSATAQNHSSLKIFSHIFRCFRNAQVLAFRGTLRPRFLRLTPKQYRHNPTMEVSFFSWVFQSSFFFFFESSFYSARVCFKSTKKSFLKDQDKQNQQSRGNELRKVLLSDRISTYANWFQFALFFFQTVFSKTYTRLPKSWRYSIALRKIFKAQILLVWSIYKKSQKQRSLKLLSKIQKVYHTVFWGLFNGIFWSWLRNILKTTSQAKTFLDHFCNLDTIFTFYLFGKLKMNSQKWF